MNLQNYGPTIEENEATEDENVISMFTDSFKRKTKFHPSLFENSFTQKIVSSSLINYQDHAATKFMEFNLSSSDFLTDLPSLTAHIKCCIKELKPDGSIINLDDNLLIGTIPSSLISNVIKNFRLFIFDTQISTEKSDRYSLTSYVTNYFNSQLTHLKHFDMENGYYIDQSEPDYLATSYAKECSETGLENETISRGFFESGSNFANSVSLSFCEKLNSPFLFTQPNLLLPQVSKNRKRIKFD